MPNSSKFLDCPPEIILRIALLAAEDGDRNALKGLRITPALNKIRKIAQYKRIHFDLRQATNLTDIITATMSSIQEDDDITHHVRTLSLNGQLRQRKYPDDIPHLEISPWDVTRLLQLFPRIQHLKLTCFAWSPPSDDEQTSMDKANSPRFPELRRLHIEDAEVVEPTPLPFNVLTMLPSIQHFSLSISKYAPLTIPYTWLPTTNTLHTLRIHEAEASQAGSYAALIKSLSSSIQTLHVGLASRPKWCTMDHAWALFNDTYFSALTKVSFSIAQRAWNEQCMLRANIKTISNILRFTRRTVTDITISVNPPILLDTAPNGWVADVDWDELGTHITTAPLQPATSIHIIGSHLIPDTEPRWNEDEWRKSCGAFKTFVDNVKPTFIKLAWVNRT